MTFVFDVKFNCEKQLSSVNDNGSKGVRGLLRANIIIRKVENEVFRIFYRFVDRFKTRILDVMETGEKINGKS